MIKKLSSKLEESGEPKSRWTVFIGQHQSGGLRQIVVKDGELALTRMTPVSNYDGDRGAWVKEVHQEFKATMSYLGRLGYDPNDGLKVIFIADDERGDALSPMIDAQCTYQSLTVSAAANKLGLQLSVPDDAEHFADYLHAAWIGSKSSFILPMKAKRIDTVSKPRQIAAIASLLLLLGGAFQAYQLVSQIPEVARLSGEIGKLKTKEAKLFVERDAEIKKQEELGFDVKLVQSALDVHKDLEAQQIQALDVFMTVGQALGKDMRIDRIDVLRGVGPTIAGTLSGDTQNEKRLFKASMQMSFPSTTNAQRGNKEVQALKERMQVKLPGHMVKVTKLLEDYEYSEEIVVESGDLDKPQVSQDFVAEITIWGPEQE